MKKTLLLLYISLLSLLFLNLETTYAWNLNDSPISELNGLTLNEVFENNNLDTYNQISYSNAELIISNNNWTMNYVYLSETQSWYVRKGKTGNSTNYKYLRFNYVSKVGNARIYSDDIGYISDMSRYNFDYGVQSYILIPRNNQYDLPFYIRASSSDFNNVLFEDVLLIDLTDLGIDNLTKEQIDYYYNLYQTQKSFNHELIPPTDEKNVIQDVENFGTNLMDFITDANEFVNKEIEFSFLGTEVSFSFKTVLFTGFFFGTLMTFLLIKKFIPGA